MTRFFVGITGASGHRYAEALIRAFVAAGHEVDLSITDAGAKVLRHELGVEAGARGELLSASLTGWLGPQMARSVRAFPSAAIEAPPSSGTHRSGGAVICPCSMGTLARVAAGFSSNLVERAADVALKEGRPLILVPRETPFSPVHLENLLRLSRMGAVVLPACPGFYHHPRTIDDLVGHVVGKILDRLGVERDLAVRWKGTDRLPEDPGTGAPLPQDALHPEPKIEGREVKRSERRGERKKRRRTTRRNTERRR